MDFFFVVVLLGQKITFLHSHRCCLLLTGMGAKILHQSITQGLVGFHGKKLPSFSIQLHNLGEKNMLLHKKIITVAFL